MDEFKIPPVSALIGSNPINYYRILKNGGKIDPPYYLKLFFTSLIVIATVPFHIFEYFVFRKKIRNYKFSKQPIFILGHWRSGTTYLHNMLCSDPDAAYLTTYHSVFPNFLASKFIFKSFMKKNMPSNRPGDNVELEVGFPQEDEVALGNLTANSFYHCYYFPEIYESYYKKAVTDVNNGDCKSWDTIYREIVIKAVLNSKGERAVLKNPVNTGRITTLLRIFPNAKFIYIYRDPVVVFLSLRKFYYELIPNLNFQNTSKQFIDKMIYDIFVKIISDYEGQKHLIPKENLMQIEYDQFICDPLEACRTIYENLLGEDFSTKKIYFTEFLEKQKGFKGNKYNLASEEVKNLYTQLKEYYIKWKYDDSDYA